MRGSRQLLVKVVPFQFRGYSNPQDNVSAYFCPDSKSSTIGLLNELSITSECFWKDGDKYIKSVQYVKLPEKRVVFYTHQNSNLNYRSVFASAEVAKSCNISVHLSTKFEF